MRLSRHDAVAKAAGVISLADDSGLGWIILTWGSGYILHGLWGAIHHMKLKQIYTG